MSEPPFQPSPVGRSGCGRALLRSLEVSHGETFRIHHTKGRANTRCPTGPEVPREGSVYGRTSSLITQASLTDCWNRRESRLASHDESGTTEKNPTHMKKRQNNEDGNSRKETITNTNNGLIREPVWAGVLLLLIWNEQNIGLGLG